MESLFDELLDAARRLGVAVRHVHLGGAGGGLAKVKGKSQLFVDLDADPQDQLEQVARAVAKLDGLDALFLRPDVREAVGQHISDEAGDGGGGGG